MKFICTFICLAMATVTFSQSDTTFYYYTDTYRETTPDSSTIVLKLYKKEAQWMGREVYKKSGITKSEGSYAANNPATPVGSFKNFTDKGLLQNESVWGNDSKIVSKTFFYKNGSRKSFINYGDKSILKQQGWDEEGKEIKNYVVEREARFKGGLEGWRKYLEKNLNANVAADAGAPAGTYEVKVSFIINREGYVSQVKAMEIPKACKPCAAEAVNVIASGPNWEPAIQNNQPVLYNAIQSVIFAVVEDKGKKKKG